MRLPPARTTAGKAYQPNAEYRGMGAMRHCACCQDHRPIGPGWKKYGTSLACASCVALMSAQPPTPRRKAAAKPAPVSTITARPLAAWQQPGYRFAIDWPPGFVAQIEPANNNQCLRRSVDLNARSPAIVGGRQ